MKFFVIEKKRFLTIQLRNSTMKYLLKRSNDRGTVWFWCLLRYMYIHILFVAVRSQYKFIFDWNVVWTYDTQFLFIYHFHCLQYYINFPGSSKTLLIGQLLNYFTGNSSIDLAISYKLWVNYKYFPFWNYFLLNYVLGTSVVTSISCACFFYRY